MKHPSNRVTPEQVAAFSAVLLERCGLPPEYNSLTTAERKRERIRVLTSWYDPNLPDALCTDVDAFMKANCLWRYRYMRRARCNRAIYKWDEPLHVEQLIRAAMSPALAQGQPSKAVEVAARGSGKTWKLVIENMSMIAVCRPGTNLMLSECTRPLTKRKMVEIRRQIEQNENIHADFGGEGDLYYSRTKGTYLWTAEDLYLLNDSKIVGISVMSAMRGNRCDYGVVDDWENEKNLREADFRANFFNWMFGAYLPMFSAGGHAVFVQTFMRAFENTCASMMIDGRSVADGVESEDGQEDERLKDWKRVKVPLIQEDATGRQISMWEEKTTVEDFHRALKIDYAGTMAEMQCELMPSGYRSFNRDEARNGYLRFYRTGGEECALDMRTGKEIKWDDLVASLAIYGGCDLAASDDMSADPAAIVIVGFDPEGTAYVLDVWQGRKSPDRVVERMFEMCDKWPTARIMAMERTAFMWTAVNQAQTIRDERIAAGKASPDIHPVTSQGRSKPKRILFTLTSAVNGGNIRFRHGEEYQLSDERRYKPIGSDDQRYHEALKKQVDIFTDETRRGIDALDAMEMAFRVAGRARGTAVVDEDRTIEEEIEEWNRLGVNVTPPVHALAASRPMFDPPVPYVEKKQSGIEIPEFEMNPYGF